jgi:TFIIF-interacting CTD phosphatase-like protein
MDSTEPSSQTSPKAKTSPKEQAAPKSNEKQNQKHLSAKKQPSIQSSQSSPRSEGEEKQAQQQEVKETPCMLEISESSSLRKLISMAISALRKSQQVILTGYGPIEVTKLVQMVEIIKARLGMLHQLNKVVVQHVK